MEKSEIQRLREAAIKSISREAWRLKMRRLNKAQTIKEMEKFVTEFFDMYDERIKETSPSPPPADCKSCAVGRCTKCGNCCR